MNNLMTKNQNPENQIALFSGKSIRKILFQKEENQKVIFL
jgi:hypothetical protein